MTQKLYLSALPDQLIAPYVFEHLEGTCEVYPDAFLAGGYLRDKLLGRPVKDADFFTFYDLAPGRSQISQPGISFEDDGHSRIKCVEGVVTPFEVEVDSLPHPIELIHLNPMCVGDVEEENKAFIAVSQFCFGFMQVMYDSNSDMIVATPEYIHDVSQEVITVRRCLSPYEAYSIVGKYFSLMGKYSWPLVVPEKYAEMFEAVPAFHTIPEDQRRIETMV